MGIERFDFLYNQALAMLGYMNAINASLDTTHEKRNGQALKIACLNINFVFNVFIAD